MPEDFERCVRSDGRVKTISGPNEKFGLKKGEYRRVCFKNGKMYKGHIEKKKSESETAKAAKEYANE